MSSFPRYRTRVSLTGVTLIALCGAPSLASAKAANTPLRVVATTQTQCLRDPALAREIESQVGAAFARNWTIRIAPADASGMQITLTVRGRDAGQRRFREIPERCADLRNLVTTVAVLAMENWRNEHPQQKPRTPKRDKAKAGSGAGSRRPARQNNRGSGRRPSDDAGTNADRPSSDTRTQIEDANTPRDATLEAGGTGTPAPDDGVDRPAEQPAAPQTTAQQATEQPTEPPTEQATDQEDTDPQDSARALARAQAERQRQRNRERFALQRGVALTIHWGAAAQIGPALYGWLGARKRRWAMRGGVWLSYGPARRLGQARLHSGSMAGALELCARPRALSSSRAPLWGCLTGKVGTLWGAGRNTDQDLQGFRPWGNAGLAVELPLTKRDTWALRISGAAHLWRTRFELRAQTPQAPVIETYTLPPFHIGVGVGWRG